MKHIVYTLLLLFLLSSCAYAQSGQRIKLTQLEQAPTVSGSRQGQIGMSDVAGNQRYTPYVIIADTCTNTAPTPSGNTNISQFVYNCAGDSIWYIDWKGDAILLGGGGGAGCDADWLDIVANDCPDSINDSIYTYRYASVGARYAWPLAEFLVNDSTGTAIAVIQGSRNARLGLHDSENDTWTAINHGGTTTSWYLERDAELIVTAAAGSISIPTIPFTNHFGIRTGDSTLVFYRYPNTRADSNTVQNLLHTDATGVLRSANWANAINNIGFGNVMYHDDTDSGPERVGSWANRFNGTFVSALDSLLANTAEGARVEISPGRTTLSAYPSVARNGKYINIEGGPGSYLDVTGQFSYNSPDTITAGMLLFQADTVRFGGALTNALSTQVMPTGHRIDVRCNTIINSGFSLAKSGYFNLKAKNWTSNTGTYLINPVYTQPKLGDTVTNVNAYIDIDQITLTGTGTAPRALSYLNAQFDSCALEYRIGSIKKAGTIPAATGRGFAVHVYSFGSTDTTVVNNSKINTTIGSVSLEGTGASDNPLICFRPGTPGGGTDYPIYVRNSQINYDLGAVATAEKLIEFSARTEITNSQLSLNVGNYRVTNDNGIYFQRVALDSSTIVFEGDFTSTAAGVPLIYLDSITFTNGARIIFRGRFEHQSDGTPVVQILNMSTAPAGSIIFENCTLVAYDTVTIHGTATVTARGLVTTRAPQSTITVQGVRQQGAALQVTDLTSNAPATIGAWSTQGFTSRLVPGTNLSISNDTLNAAGGSVSLPTNEIGYGTGAGITSSTNLQALPTSSGYRVTLNAQNAGQGFTADSIATGGDAYAMTSVATGAGAVNALDGTRTAGSGTLGVSISNTGTGPAQFFAASASNDARTVYDGQHNDFSIGYRAADTTLTIAGGTDLSLPAVQVRPNYQVVTTANVANTNSAADRLVIRTNSTGTPAAGFGGSILFQGKSSTTDNRDIARINANWTSATDATRASQLSIFLANSGALSERLRIGISSITPLDNFTIGGTSALTLGGSSGALVITSSFNGGLLISPNSVSNINNRLVLGDATYTNTSGIRYLSQYLVNFSPTSGTAQFKNIAIENTINQTGGANGNTWGIDINPTLTAVGGTYYAIDIAANSASAKGIFQSGASTTNNFVGGTVFGATTAPNAAAALEVNSTTKGFLLPRMTEAQRDAIGTPPDGLMLYNTTTNKAQVRAAGAWVDLH
jgi:hypothetical protein